MRTILAVGAYERDNFGDYLFYEVLRRYLAKDHVLPGSVVYSDMRAAYGIVTLPYDFILSKYQVDAVWVVGGEVGGVDVPSALTMSLGLPDTTYSRAVSTDQAEAIERLYGASRRNHQAYIPDKSLYARNQDSPLIVNSVGLSHMFGDGGQSARMTLSQAAAVSVRDNISRDKLAKVGLVATVAPDVVHTLPLFYTPKAHTKVGIVFQCNTAYAEAIGLPVIGEALAEVARQHNLPITMIAAGTAFSHDSLATYQTLHQLLTDQGVTCQLVTTRSPLELVDYIAAAQCTISTSLHVRIVSAAYGVRRVSLENDKVGRYVGQWDAAWPAQVSITELSAAVATAYANDQANRPRRDLTDQAKQNLDRLVAALPSQGRHRHGLDHAQLEAAWQAHMQRVAVDTITAQAAIIHNQQQQIDQANHSFARARADAQYYHDQWQQVVGSRAWRWLRRLRRVVPSRGRR